MTIQYPFLPIVANAPLGMPEIFIITILVAIIALVAVLPFWFICKKAGLSPWLSCLMVIPFGAIVLPFVLAFIEWPALKQNVTARQ